MKKLHLVLLAVCFSITTAVASENLVRPEQKDVEIKLVATNDYTIDLQVNSLRFDVVESYDVAFLADSNKSEIFVSPKVNAPANVLQSRIR